MALRKHRRRRHKFRVVLYGNSTRLGRDLPTVASNSIPLTNRYRSSLLGGPSLLEDMWNTAEGASCRESKRTEEGAPVEAGRQGRQGWEEFLACRWREGPRRLPSPPPSEGVRLSLPGKAGSEDIVRVWGGRRMGGAGGG